ncbi:MAG TPA: hypothetical protein VFF40_03020 [Acidimicrobiia bacterium]|nr:hypothetical protein [Acidimicrobiia bacterium]
MAFVQTLAIKTSDRDAVKALMAQWDADQRGVAPGYQSQRLLADRDRPGVCVIEVEFSSYEEAQRNNERPETAAWSEKLQGLVDGDTTYANLDVL